MLFLRKKKQNGNKTLPPRPKVKKRRRKKKKKKNAKHTHKTNKTEETLRGNPYFIFAIVFII